MDTVRIDVFEREKTLQCSELVTVGSVCAFTIYRDGAKLADDGYLIFRLMPPCPPPMPGSPPGPYGLGAVAFEQGETGETDIMKEAWLVDKLRFLPVGTVAQISVTVVTEGEGTAALGVMNVLVPTVAEITERKPWAPYERVAMFRGEQGMPGVATVNGDPHNEIDPQIRVAVNVDGKEDVIREVPPCPEDAGQPGVEPYYLVALENGKYGWAHIQLPSQKLSLSDMPGKLYLVNVSGTGWQLVQSTMKWNDATQNFKEDKNTYFSEIGVPTNEPTGMLMRANKQGDENNTLLFKHLVSDDKGILEMSCGKEPWAWKERLDIAEPSPSYPAEVRVSSMKNGSFSVEKMFHSPINGESFNNDLSGFDTLQKEDTLAFEREITMANAGGEDVYLDDVHDAIPNKGVGANKLIALNEALFSQIRGVLLAGQDQGGRRGPRRL